MFNKRVWNGILGCNLKNDRIISVRFQGKPFNITVIQVYAPTNNAEEAEVEQFYEDLQDLLELTPKKDVLFVIGDWNAKVGSQETPGKWKWKWNRSVVSNSLRPVDCSPPSSSIHGILQARILELVAMSFSRGSSRPRDRTQVSHIAGRRFNLCTTREALLLL